MGLEILEKIFHISVPHNIWAYFGSYSVSSFLAHYLLHKISHKNANKKTNIDFLLQQAKKVAENNLSEHLPSDEGKNTEKYKCFLSTVTDELKSYFFVNSHSTDTSDMDNAISFLPKIVRSVHKKTYNTLNHQTCLKLTCLMMDNVMETILKVPLYLTNEEIHKLGNELKLVINEIPRKIAGRNKEILLFQELLDNDNKYGLWLHGPGGIGKSELVRHLCRISKNNGYMLMGNKDKISDEDPLSFLGRVGELEREQYQVLESKNIKAQILAKLVKKFIEDTIIIIDASKDFESPQSSAPQNLVLERLDSLVNLVESLIERLKDLDSRVFLLIATRSIPPYSSNNINLTEVTCLTTEEEVKEFIDIKGGDEELKQYAKILLKKTAGWPLGLEAIIGAWRQ